MLAELGNFAKRFGVPRLDEMCARSRIKVEGTKLIISPSQFSQDMDTLVNNKLFSDVSFVVQGQTVPSHKGILTKRCKYFERLFESDFKEKEQLFFPIDETISLPIFICVLKYLYANDESIITPENAVDLLHAADRFMMEDLKAVVEAYIESSIDLDNSCDILDISDRVSAYRLKRVCLELMCESSKDNLDSVRLTEGFVGLKESAPHLIREIDYRASKSGLARPGEIVRTPLPIALLKEVSSRKEITV